MPLSFTEVEALEETIQAYLNQQLPAQDLEQFEQQMDSTPGLLEEIKEREQLRFVHQNRDLLQLDQVLKDIIRENPIPNIFDSNKDIPSDGGAGFATWWLFGAFIAGALLSLLLTTGIDKLNSSTSIDPQLIHNYLQPFENVYNANANGENLLGQGMLAYQEGEYESAIPLLQRYYSQQSDAMAGLYLGVAQLMTDKNKESLQVFESLLGKANPVLKGPIRWYYALALVKEKQWTAARQQLKGLQDNPQYRLQVKALLYDLEW